MDIYVNFCIQAVLCIITFIPVYLLLRSTDRLEKKLEGK